MPMLFSKACTDHKVPQERSFIVTITDASKPENFTIPLQCKGWCVRGATVLENTANDSTLIWDKYFASGAIGKVFSMECYDCYLKTVWDVQYRPYKATKGKIVIQWFVRPN